MNDLIEQKVRAAGISAHTHGDVEMAHNGPARVHSNALWLLHNGAARFYPDVTDEAGVDAAIAEFKANTPAEFWIVPEPVDDVAPAAPDAA